MAFRYLPPAAPGSNSNLFLQQELWNWAGFAGTKMLSSKPARSRHPPPREAPGAVLRWGWLSMD